MADLNRYFPTLLKHEGGFVNNPKDPGGATNKGITFGTFKSVAKKLLGIEPSIENLKKLSSEQALKIYRVNYWSPICGDEILHEPTAFIVFDFYVNAGKPAIKLLQQTLVSQGFKIVVDGVMGPLSYKALNAGNNVVIYNAYKQARINYYTNLAKRRPTLKVFLKGWLKRVESFPTL